MPKAPSSESLCTASTAARTGRVASPNRSLACQPTVHRPKLNLSSRVGWGDINVLLISVIVSISVIVVVILLLSPAEGSRRAAYHQLRRQLDVVRLELLSRRKAHGGLQSDAAHLPQGLAHGC